MKKGVKKIKKHLDIVIPVLILGLISVLSGINFFQKFDYRFYDSLLGQSKEIETNSDIVLIDINDESLDQVGTWPWTRDIIADVLIRMREFNSKIAVFDIEYLSPSVKAVDDNIELITEDSFIDGEAEIANSVKKFAHRISDGTIPLSQVNQESDSLIQNQIDSVLYEMNKTITSAFSKDNDEYFARAVQFFGKSFLTINMRKISINSSEEDIDYAYKRFLFSNVKDDNRLINKGNTFTTKEEGKDVERAFIPALHKIIKNAYGAGFTNVVVDKDGIRRRVELLNYKDDKYTGQLSFAPLMHYLDVQEFVRTRNSLILKGAKFPGEEERCDVKIPLDKNGRMLINWLHENYEDSFNHVPIHYIINIDKKENLIISLIEKIISSDLSLLSLEDKAYILQSDYFLMYYDELSAMKNRLLVKCKGYDENNNLIRGGISQSDYDNYFKARSDFFAELKEFVKSFSTISNYKDLEDLVNLESLVLSYEQDFNTLKSALDGAFCIIGNSASASTDLGATPFEKRYSNLGTHANVINTILQRKFITEIDSFVGLILTFVLSLVIIIISKRLTPLKKNILNLSYVLVPMFVFMLLMVIFKVYIPMVGIFLYALLTYISNLFLNFVLVENDKKYIKNAFSQCLSPDVVEQIVKQPDNFKLGGQKLEMTAIFTDIQKFSTFSELLSASQLVALLNYYLTRMSDIIMAEGGTIDKYEGDAIIAFVGAPVPMEDHAQRACAAAIKMKKMEKKINDEIVNIVANQKPEEMDDDLYDALTVMVNNNRRIFTRIGINSGEMVAGFMGSESKKNYTMMGNNVNLASRLEGVNKQYCTNGIIISEATKKLLGDRFLLRSLDTVKVVNVNTPIRLYELLDEKSCVDEKYIKYIDNWEKTIEIFRKRYYQKSLALFKKISEINPKDYVAKYYISLLERFFVKGKYPSEKDDVGVAYNVEEGYFKLLQK